MFNFLLILLFTTSFAHFMKFLAHTIVQYKPETTSIPRELNIIKSYIYI